MDSARTIKKLEASEVYVIYRRAEEQMPAEKKEIADAKKEGIEFLFQTNIVKILGKENEYEDLFKARRVEPIKNRVEVGNMLKEANKSILMSRFKIPKDEIDDIKIGEGKIIEIDNKKVGVYKANTGEIFKVKPICTHLGCELYFNNIDKTWECPCHGSKFSYDGKSIEVPSNKNLE